MPKIKIIFSYNCIKDIAIQAINLKKAADKILGKIEKFHK